MIHTELMPERCIQCQFFIGAEEAVAVCPSDVGKLPQKVMCGATALLKFYTEIPINQTISRTEKLVVWSQYCPMRHRLACGGPRPAVNADKSTVSKVGGGSESHLPGFCALDSSCPGPAGRSGGLPDCSRRRDPQRLWPIRTLSAGSAGHDRRHAGLLCGQKPMRPLPLCRNQSA